MSNRLLPFCKFTSGGQDYIFVDGRHELHLDYSVIAPLLCNRVTGIGAEALVVVEPSKLGDAKLSVISSSRTKIRDDNYLRCAGRYVYGLNILSPDSRRFRLEAPSEVVVVEVIGKGERVRIKMGPPTFEGALIPTASVGIQLNKAINVDGIPYTISVAGLGQAHCVIFGSAIDYVDLAAICSKLEKHVYFPNGVNVSFVEIVNPEHLKARFWQKGVGEVLSYGEACCAIGAVAIELEKATRKHRIETAGGEFEVAWADSEEMYLTGTAFEVFRGEIDIEQIIAQQKSSPLS